MCPSGNISANIERSQALSDQDIRSLREGDLVDVYEDSVWREAVIERLFSDRENTALVRFLFPLRGDEPMEVQLHNPRKVQQNGAKTDLMLVQPGSLVDVNLGDTTYAAARVRRIFSGGRLKVRLLRTDESFWVFFSDLRPYGSKSEEAQHPDNRLRQRFCIDRGWSDRPDNILGYESQALATRSSEKFDADEGDINFHLESKAGGYEANLEYPLQSRKRVRGVRGEAYRTYVNALKERNLSIVEMVGDGNCLFRAISHQVYGTAAHHALVREYCVNYMEYERAYFEPFVVGGKDGFDAYVAHKRKSGVWGDDIELQAMCELYDRPAEVYTFDAYEGARCLRTFHEDNRRRPPMMLSFYGGGHYDSIQGPNFTSGLSYDVGRLEEQRISYSMQKQQGQRSENLSANQLAEQARVDEAIRHSREQYVSASGDLESALQLSREMETIEDKSRVRSALFDSVVETGTASSDQLAIAATDLAATEQAELEEVLRLSAQADLGYEDEDSELQRVLQLSSLEANHGNLRGSDTEDEVEVQRAIEASIHQAQH
mmetsp:Transcript_9648/g.17765  ORF Transcript_9648/g.17765 Transcript_9648/m.17765 type:complete len:546 (-) Transcript_9648:1879-3516(-)